MDTLETIIDQLSHTAFRDIASLDGSIRTEIEIEREMFRVRELGADAYVRECVAEVNA